MRVIDLHHLGHERVIGCWQIGDVLVDPGPSSCMETLIESLGQGFEPRALLLTHIHLDHAGASGSLVKRWPQLEVYVHERGAPHMVSPERLLKSAKRLYGDDMDRRWGAFDAVPQERLRVLTGGETVAFDSAGTFEVAYTPGHASHHVSYLHDGTAFVGDVGGVQIAPGTPAIPPTPPPDVDIELWKESIALVRGWKPERLAMTHFGDATDVDEHLSDVEERLSRWSELARHGDEAAFITAIRAEIAAEVPPEIAAAFEQAAPADQLYAGYARYWHKRSEHRAEQGAERGS